MLDFVAQILRIGTKAWQWIAQGSRLPSTGNQARKSLPPPAYVGLQKGPILEVLGERGCYSISCSMKKVRQLSASTRSPTEASPTHFASSSSDADAAKTNIEQKQQKDSSFFVNRHHSTGRSSSLAAAARSRGGGGSCYPTCLSLSRLRGSGYGAV